MKEKYIEELVGGYFKMDFSGKDKGFCYIFRTDIDGADVVDYISCEDAETLCKDRAKILKALNFAILSHGDNAHDILDKIRKDIYLK